MSRMISPLWSRALRAAVIGACIANVAPAQTPVAGPSQPKANTVRENPLKNAYFGQLHLHTGMSFDAYIIGTRIYPEDAYRFARGEEIEQNGRKVKTDVPLDFLGVSDHSEYLGQLRLLGEPDGPLAQTPFGKLYNAASPEKRLALIFKLSETYGSGGEKPAELLTRDIMKSNWQRQIDAAEKFYQPGKFTTFVAYEWSSLPNGANLHRNVIFRGPKYPELPFSSVDSPNPENLWRYIEHQRANGIQVLAIPHNSNVSDGLMWSYADSNRNPIDREYAETRVGIERLVEITQTKGTSETRPELSPNDDFAGFELIENLLTVPRPSSINGSYVRQAYARGLELERRTGVNPFEFGLIGGSDTTRGCLSPARTIWSARMQRTPMLQNCCRRLRDSAARKRAPRASRVSGPRATRAKPSSMRCIDVRRSQPRVPGLACASSRASNTLKALRSNATGSSTPMSSVCRWAPTWSHPRQTRRGHCAFWCRPPRIRTARISIASRS